MGGCGWNEKDNSCEDVGNAGVATVTTDNTRFINYMPHGWMKTPGAYSAVADEVKYDATPVYSGLDWAPCQHTCSSRAHTGAVLFTGVKSDHRKGEGEYDGHMYESNTVISSGFSCGNGGSCPPSWAKNTGETPCRQRRCDSCWKVSDKCKSGAGHSSCHAGQYQSLCAREIDMSRTCESIGSVSASGAVVTIRDARGVDASADGDGGDFENVTTADPKFSGRSYGFAECSYPSFSLVTPEHALEFGDKMREGKVPSDFQFRGPLMESFCGRVIENSDGGRCIGNHFTGVPEKCSYYLSTTGAGAMCRDWVKEIYGRSSGTGASQVPKTYDEVVRDHCDANPGLDECTCRRREDDPMYNDLINYGVVQQGSAACWYAPCRSGLDQGMFLDSETKGVLDANQCATTICANVYTYINSHYNTSNGVDQLVSCDLGGGGDSGGGGAGGATDVGGGSATVSPNVDGSISGPDPSDATLSSLTTDKDGGGESSFSLDGFMTVFSENSIMKYSAIGIGLLIFFGLLAFAARSLLAKPAAPTAQAAVAAPGGGAVAPAPVKASVSKKKARAAASSPQAQSKKGVIGHLFSESDSK